MPGSPDEMMAAMLANLPEKTGKPLDAWLTRIQAQGFEKHGQIMSFLEGEHGLTHGYANMLALKARGYGEQAGGDDALVDGQYAGPKAGLRPIYEALVKACKACGKDVEIAPRKTQVTIRRSRVFAIVKAATRTRVDLGLRLDDEPVGERLGPPGAFGGMATHKVALASAKDVDKQLKAWLKRAYAAS